MTQLDSTNRRIFMSRDGPLETEDKFKSKELLGSVASSIRDTKLFDPVIA